MLIDVHAHFHHPAGARSDWQAVNASRLRAGAQMGITHHIASILGSWGRTSPTYFPSMHDVTEGNNALLSLMQEHAGVVCGYACVNPNYTEHALHEIARCLDHGMIGIKLAASRRANDPLLDPIAEVAAERQAPILHHIWQGRQHEWPGQEASDAIELCQLAARHPKAYFILAHIGGGGDWRHSLRVLPDHPNVMVDLSGSGVDRGMLEGCLAAVGVKRLLWGCDLTMCTGLGKLRYLRGILTDDEYADMAWRNAARIFAKHQFGTA